MRPYMRAAVLRFKLRKANIAEADLSPIEYDMKAINRRAQHAMARMGKTRVEVAEFFGMDSSIPLAMQPREKIPRPTMGNVVKLAEYLGVSIRWMLYGDIENDVDQFVMRQNSNAPVMAQVKNSAEQGAAIISGASNSTVIVQNISGVNDMEREMITAIRRLPIKEQAAVMAYIFSLEKELGEK